MAVQTRRGAYENFDPSKLLAGEWATVLSGDPNASDGRAAYLCFEPGEVKRMATYEDMVDNITLATEEVANNFMSEVNAALDEAEAALSNMTAATSAANTAASNAQTIADTVEGKLEAGEFVGPQGQAATIQIGTVTTGAAGSSASVTNSGTSSAAVLDFTIPQGEQGDPGAIKNISAQSITFSEASQKADLVSGDSLATLFGKLQKYMTETDDTFENIVDSDTIQAAKDAGILSGGG